MTETPKDKRERALERIKALSSKRATGNRPDVEPGGQPSAKGPKGGGAKKGVAHRPQGG
jgi:hypothetical protein